MPARTAAAFVARRLPLLQYVFAAVYCVGRAASVISAPVAPGGTVRLNSPDFIAPTGLVVADEIRDLTLSYIAPADWEFGDGKTTFDVAAALRQRVLRDPTTSRLTFVYDLVNTSATPTGVFGNEHVQFIVGSFANVATDVSVQSGFGTIDVTRADDGSALTFLTPDFG